MGMSIIPGRKTHKPIAPVPHPFASMRCLFAALVLTLSLAACGGGQNPARIHMGGLTPPPVSPTRYFPKERAALDPAALVGDASWYGGELHGNRTATGERFDMYSFTAAHRTLPFNTIVRVVRDDDRRSVVVRINDRGPGSPHRCIDLAWAAAYEIGMASQGHTAVRLEILHWGDGAIYEQLR